MKKTWILPMAAAVFATALTGPAQARVYRHGGGCGYVLYRDYSFSNAQSPSTYIYPTANWGPLFHCYRYFGPVLVLNAAPN